MTLPGLLVAALAAWQAVEVWHHGSMFAGRRAAVQAWPDRGVRGWLAALLTCPFCLSVWVGFASAAAVTADMPQGDAVWVWAGWLGLGLVKLFAYGLAVSRLANLGNDLTKGVSRTPDQTKTSEAAGPRVGPAVYDPPNTAIEDRTDELQPVAVPFPDPARQSERRAPCLLDDPRTVGP